MTHQDAIALDRALRSAREAGRRCALATIVSTRGSTPRKVGARMVVDPERGLVGTIGGGCGEAEVIEIAHKVASSGRPERVRVNLTDDLLSWSPAVCGGVMDVFVEAVLPPPPHVRIHYRRPPDREDVFDQTIVLQREDVVVTYAPSAPVSEPVVVDGHLILEPGAPAVWFTFPGAWHDIGRFHRRDGTFTGFYANVLTPPEMEEGEWRTTDLFLDVWLPESGEPRLLDEDELEEAATNGWIDAETAARARQEAATLLEQARAGSYPEITRQWTLPTTLAHLGLPPRPIP